MVTGWVMVELPVAPEPVARAVAEPKERASAIAETDAWFDPVPLATAMASPPRPKTPVITLEPPEPPVAFAWTETLVGALATTIEVAKPPVPGTPDKAFSGAEPPRASLVAVRLAGAPGLSTWRIEMALPAFPNVAPVPGAPPAALWLIVKQDEFHFHSAGIDQGRVRAVTSARTRHAIAAGPSHEAGAGRNLENCGARRTDRRGQDGCDPTSLAPRVPDAGTDAAPSSLGSGRTAGVISGRSLKRSERSSTIPATPVELSPPAPPKLIVRVTAPPALFVRPSKDSALPGRTRHSGRGRAAISAEGFLSKNDRCAEIRSGERIVHY